MGEAVRDLIVQQEKMIQQLEEQRSAILGLLQRGKDIMRDSQAPQFLRDDVKNLEANWNDCYGQSVNHLKRLKTNQKVWEDYKMQKVVMAKLLEDVEVELQKIIPKHNHKMIQHDLKAKKQIKEEVKKATDELLVKMKEISE